MSTQAAPRWRFGAKLASVVLAVHAVWMFVVSVRGLLEDRQEARWDVTGVVVLALLVGALTALMIWLAWRLWARWSAGTVRWAVGFALAMLLMAVASPLLGAEERYRPWLSVLHVPLLLLGALAYRWLTQWIIGSARLLDPLDASGHQAGHSERVRAFALLLGLVVLFALTDLFRAAVTRPDPPRWVPWLWPLALAGGWAAYRLVLWLMLPRPFEQAKAATGFEVLPVPTEHGPSTEARHAAEQ